MRVKRPARIGIKHWKRMKKWKMKTNLWGTALMKRKRKKTATQHEIGNKKETMMSETELEMD